MKNKTVSIREDIHKMMQDKIASEVWYESNSFEKKLTLVLLEAEKELYSWHLSEMKKMLKEIIESSICYGMYSPDDIAKNIVEKLNSLKQK